MHFKSLSYIARISLSFLLLFIFIIGVKADTPLNRNIFQNAVYISPVIKTGQAFTGLGIEWHQEYQGTSGEDINFSIRYYDHNKWSPWYLIEADIDGFEEADKKNPSAFLPMNATDAFQYKIHALNSNINIKNIVESLKFTYVDVPQNVASVKQNFVASGKKFIAQNNSPFGAAPDARGNINIISRSAWGADESLRSYKETNVKPTLVKTESDFENKYADELKIIKTVDIDSNGRQLTWPLKYPEKISKIIVHHTASSKDLDDPAKAIRNIYYWHAVTRGWGDIGYNYLIDQQGNIYEGRYGGDGVVGAHAGIGNVGSIGIAVLGNYEDSDVPDNVLKSLVALIKSKVETFNIDPAGFASFRGANFANIFGHRDIVSTSCPGEKLYAQLPGLRIAVKTGFKPVIIDRGPYLAVNQNYDFQPAGDLVLPEFEPGATKEFSVSLKNTGPNNWGPKTFLTINRDLNAMTFFPGKDFIESSRLGKEVGVGETGTFTLKLTAGYRGGFSAIEFVPIVDGIRKVEKYLSVPVQIKQPNYDYEITNIVIPKPYLKINEREEITIEVKNKGNFIWKGMGPNKFTLGTEQPRDHINTLLARNSQRLGTLEETEVKPGESGHVVIRLRAPKQTGRYLEYFTPLVEGVSWFAPQNHFLDVYVYKNEYDSNLIGKSGDTIFVPGESKKLWIDTENLGGIVWNEPETNLIEYEIKNPDGLKIENLVLEEKKLVPGQRGRISFTLTAPENEGFYYVQIKPKIGDHALITRPAHFFLRVIKNPNSGATGTVAPSSTALPQQTTGTSNFFTVKNNIRISLGFHGNPVISGSGSFALFDGQKRIATFQKNEKVGVNYDSKNYQISGMTEKYYSSDPPRFVPLENAILRVDNFERKSGANNGNFDNEFRGILEVRSYNSQLHVINELSIEDYLKGTGEIREQEPTEKLRSIIIAARTYAAFYIKVAEKFPGAPFNLTDDAETSQKYVGYGAEKRSPNTVKAVEDTIGSVVTWQGKLVKTPYFHSDDGRTRSAEEVWGWKDTPYLVSVPDPYCAGNTLQGHGVGLSGCGSLGMAKAGKTYEEIIKYYYQGVEIKKLE